MRYEFGKDGEYFTIRAELEEPLQLSFDEVIDMQLAVRMYINAIAKERSSGND